MTDDGNGEERDPLLVRPFVLRDTGAPDAGASGRHAADPAPTWPAAGNTEVQPRAGDGADDPTAVLHLPQARRPRGRRRLVVLTAAAGVVVLGAAAAGYAALRTDVRPALTTGLPGALPAATAPAPTPTTSLPTAAATSSASPGAGRSTSTAASASVSSSPTPSRSAPAGGATSAAPIPLMTTTAPGGGRTTTPGAPANFAPPPAGNRVGVVRGQNGLCLDLNGFVVVDDNHVQVYDCNGSGAQLWTLADDGTLRVAAKCAYVVGDNSVHIVSCDGRTPAQWRVSGQQIVNVATSRCLTDPSGGSRAGTGVVVTKCDGSAKQRWSLP